GRLWFHGNSCLPSEASPRVGTCAPERLLARSRSAYSVSERSACAHVRHRNERRGLGAARAEEAVRVEVLAAQEHVEPLEVSQHVRPVASPDAAESDNAAHERQGSVAGPAMETLYRATPACRPGQLPPMVRP